MSWVNFTTEEIIACGADVLRFVKSAEHRRQALKDIAEAYAKAKAKMKKGKL